MNAMQVLHKDGSEVFNRLNPAMEGYVLCSYQRLSGVICCVVEHYSGELVYMSNQNNWVEKQLHRARIITGVGYGVVHPWVEGA